MPKESRVWLKHELSTLSTMWRANKPLDEISKALRRTPKAVKKRRYILGLKPRRSEPWTPEEDAKLIEMWTTRARASAIQRELGRSENAVRARRRLLGLADRRSPSQAWCDTDLATLVEMWGDNADMYSIAVRLQRTERAVSQQLRRMGLLGESLVHTVRLPTDHARPKARGECEVCPSCQAYRDGDADELECDHDPETYHFRTRPCIFSGCRHHNGCDLGPSGRLTLRNCPETCSLDVAETGDRHAVEVGEAMGLVKGSGVWLVAEACRAAKKMGGFHVTSTPDFDEENSGGK